MLDNSTIQIEEMALKCGSYIDAAIEFANRFEFYDFEDLLEVLHPHLVAKIRQEFIDRNFIPGLKQNNIMDFLKD